jgi:hypothetical protein
MSIKIKASDTWFSRCVRMRAGWICESCNTQYEQGSTGLHCSHFFSRSRRSTRWHPVNAAAHCMGCHSNLGGNPIKFQEWIQRYLSEKNYALLYASARKLVKVSKKDEAEIAAHYKRTFEKMSPGDDFDIAPLLAERLA